MNKLQQIMWFFFFLLWFIIVCLSHMFQIISEHYINFMDKIMFRFCLDYKTERQLAWFVTQLCD